MSTDKQGKANKARLHEQGPNFSSLEDWELVAAIRVVAIGVN